MDFDEVGALKAREALWVSLRPQWIGLGDTLVLDPLGQWYLSGSGHGAARRCEVHHFHSALLEDAPDHSLAVLASHVDPQDRHHGLVLVLPPVYAHGIKSHVRV